MTRYRGYNQRRSVRGYGCSCSRGGSAAFCECQATKAPVDELYETARKLSDDRNKLNYAWVSDCGPDAAQRQIEHYTRLIALVGEADKAWRAVAERDGVPYTPCVDCGWLPRYTAALEHWRARFVEQTAIETSRDDDSQLSMQWLDQPESDAGGL